MWALLLDLDGVSGLLDQILHGCNPRLIGIDIRLQTLELLVLHRLHLLPVLALLLLDLLLAEQHLLLVLQVVDLLQEDDVLSHDPLVILRWSEWSEWPGRPRRKKEENLSMCLHVLPELVLELMHRLLEMPTFVNQILLLINRDLELVAVLLNILLVQKSQDMLLQDLIVLHEVSQGNRDPGGKEGGEAGTPMEL